ncbi:MAG: hypothetical protein CMN89_14670 [Sutterellaceae bacterium]|uniref:hypothetical protein n=1 Tax=uncultured Limnobacter sp. TaxID=199681 RepID=UPI000C61096A|nr:hypothetical protein [uncultured Limnobacter sp.]MAG81335.1 hypothetical protein [Sutterellaceae bacterium]MAG81435.1 hypothetical protein [Sutterellaceae bacterium]MBT85700.1 hypothetical protein [Sutterellaceae bacterium]|tara:strand:- start:2470 stop:2787 length:318 start_codon:yes stop_codon:yes gene_type:complete
MLGNFYFVLTMADHGLIPIERKQHSRDVPRYLNADGRWAASGKRVPLLVWTDQDAAKNAASIATAARKKAVTVTSVSGSEFKIGKSIHVFTPLDHDALSGYLDRS